MDLSVHVTVQALHLVAIVGVFTYPRESQWEPWFDYVIAVGSLILALDAFAYALRRPHHVRPSSRIPRAFCSLGAAGPAAPGREKRSVHAHPALPHAHALRHALPHQLPHLHGPVRGPTRVRHRAAAALRDRDVLPRRRGHRLLPGAQPQDLVLPCRPARPQGAQHPRQAPPRPARPLTRAARRRAAERASPALFPCRGAP